MKTLSNSEMNASLRIIHRDGEPWFVAKDICEVLGIQQTNKGVEKLDDDEVRQMHLIDSMGRNQKTYIVSESGLYAMILRSDKPAARQFRKWVTSVVLPEIRKTGSYAGGWEKELRDLEGECNAARALVLESEERLHRFRLLVAERLGLSTGVLEMPVPQTRNLPDGSRPTPHMIAQARRLPLPMRTKPLVQWIMQNECCKEKAARMRLHRLYKAALIIQGTDRVVRIRTDDIIPAPVQVVSQA